MLPRYVLFALVLLTGCTSIQSIPPGAYIQNVVAPHHEFATAASFRPSFGGRVTPHGLLALAGEDYFRVRWSDGTVSEWQTPRPGNRTLVFVKSEAQPATQSVPQETPRVAPSAAAARVQAQPQRDSRPPEITIIAPPVTPGMATASTEKNLAIRGRATDESGVYEVLVNDEEAELSAGGYFNATVLLAVGENKIQVKATDTKRNVGEFSFTVIRGQALPPPTVVPSGR